GAVPGAASPELRATMPGAVVALGAADGDRVEAGRPIVTVEAMKMEHAVLAPHPGVVRLEVAVGDQVRQGQVVARIELEPSDPAEQPGTHAADAAIAADPPTTAAGDPGATTASAPHEGAPA
ncbi:MAG: acetyl-CoA carboxylase biotin carboxyl carrier protein subunit, partial [Microcella sp.]|uniref:acetyl-CoA carboxylase biotin carboxyl carrier protein subunit n=1 Tax=Microcella sp. TaxID=1913979 RepID=UPI002725EAC1